MANLAEERLARVKFFDPTIDLSRINNEPRLRELIDDPITRRLMASDGIERSNLVKVLGEARAKLARKSR
ncbi:MAG TPA: hypothetical protein VGG27_20760 [Magnetospirillaceae bacterium]|jgi:hypothetical protein